MEDVEQETEQRMEQVGGPPSDSDPAVCPHGQLWTVTNHIAVDAASQSLRLKSSYLWPDALRQLIKDVKDYSFQMYLCKLCPKRWIAQLMYQQHHALSKEEFLKWLDNRLAMIAEPKRESLNVYLKTAQEQGTICMPSNYSTRFKMSRNRSTGILSCYI